MKYFNAVLLMLTCVIARSGRAAEFIPFGDTFMSISISGLSGDGTTVIGRVRHENGDEEAFAWNDGILTGLGDLPGGPIGSSADAVSFDGSVVFGESAVEPHGRRYRSHLFRWTADQGMSDLGNPAPIGGEASITVTDVTPDGSVAIGFHTDRSQLGIGGVWFRAFRWKEDSGIEFLDQGIGPQNSQAGRVTRSGDQILVGVTDAFDLWTPNGVIRVDGDFSRLADITPDGAIAVGAGNNPPQPLRYDVERGEATFLDLRPGWDRAEAQLTSSDGTTALGLARLADANETSELFFWHASGDVEILDLPDDRLRVGSLQMTADASTILASLADGRKVLWRENEGAEYLHDLLSNELGLANDVAGWQFDGRAFMSADGKAIAGHGTNPRGERAGFYISLQVPEPQSSLLFGFAILTVSVLNRRRPHRSHPQIPPKRIFSRWSSLIR